MLIKVLLPYMSFAVPRLMMTLNVQFENVPLDITLKYLLIVPEAVARSDVMSSAPVNVIKSDHKHLQIC